MVAPQLAVSKDFLESYSRLPKKTQKKVREFTEKFHHDPTQSGLNFEKIAGAIDPKARSVRIDKAYRAIVVHPPRGDVYLCVWVDHHDAAYQWVRSRRFEVNPRSGSFQVFSMVEPLAVETVAEAAVAPYAIEEAPALLADIDDEDLLLAGVPAALLPAVKELRTDDDLDDLANRLPEDAAEMLYYLAAGYSLVEAIEESDRTRPEPAKVDVEDFGAALKRPESQTTFRVLEDEDELQAMLDAPLEQWRVFLHQSQRKLVRTDAKGPVRVLGAAGTGKTVTVLHRANYLASEVYTKESDRVLVTTFTRNLALDLQMNLRNLSAPETFARIEVVNIHSWVDRFMRRQGHAFRVIRSDAKRRELFESAINDTGRDEFPLAFYMEEWDRVVQPQDVDGRDAYLTARRVGRGTRLGRKQRAQVWEVFERYRHLLDEEGMSEWQDVVRETRLYLEKQRMTLPYRAIIADEVQDFTANELKLLRAMIAPGPNDLFLVGDAHQRIYGQPTTLSSCGIEIRGRSRRLKVNYRTTKEIHNKAVAVLAGRDFDDLDGGHDTLRAYTSLRQGPAPEVRQFDRENQEASFVVERIKQWLDGGVPAEAICLAARTHALLKDRYETLLSAAGLETVHVLTDPESEAKKPGIRLATMHRLKGLEFARVILAGVQEGTMPLMTGAADDEVSLADRELQERCLLYVAATRARDALVITGFGKESPFLRD